MISKDTRHRTTLGTRFRFLVRVLGLTAILAGAAGTILSQTTLPAWSQWNGDIVQNAAQGANGTPAQVAMILLLVAALGLLAWLLVELVGSIGGVTSRKTAVGTNATIQAVLAVILLVFVNAISFQHYSRQDLTEDQRFTLEPELVARLKQLNPDTPTTVVVLQRDKTTSIEPEQADALDSAAQQKIVEKVKDVIDELRELGPRFDVSVLYTKDQNFENRLNAITTDKPALRAAIESAPENSIFFFANGRVQRLGFHQFYMLDKTASRASGQPQSEQNLVLVPQGKAAFVSKVLALEERQPKVAFAVIHPWLSSNDARDDFSAPGLRKALEQNGFAVEDIILKRGWEGDEPLGPAAATFRESQFEETEAKYLAALDAMTEAELQLAQFEEIRKRTETAPLSEVDRMFRPVLGGPVEDEDDRQILLKRLILPNIEQWKLDLADAKKSLSEVEPKYSEMLKDDRVLGDRRSKDVRQKLTAALADCDLLILSRLTVLSLADRRSITPALHNVSADQAAAIQEFIASGKPVLCAFGPTQLGPEPPGTEGGTDPVETLLERLGVRLGNEVIITAQEYQAMAARRENPLGSDNQPPALQWKVESPANKDQNPLSQALTITNRSTDGRLQIVRSGFRPVELFANVREQLTYSAEVLSSPPESWNKAWPSQRAFGDPSYMPKYEPTKPDDPRQGTPEEERKGQFPVGQILETTVPAEWLDVRASQLQASQTVGLFAPTSMTPSVIGLASTQISANEFYQDLPKDNQLSLPKVRLAVFGHGGLFNGKDLDAGRETLLLHTVNWLLNRTDRLPSDVPEEAKWRYPRVQMSEVEFSAWRWGTFLGLPALAAYVGLIALMLRRLR